MRAATPGPTWRMPLRKPIKPVLPCTTWASDPPASIRYRRCSARAGRNGSGGSRSFHACWHTFIASWSPHEQQIPGGEMTADVYYANGNEVQLFEQASQRHIPVMLT